MKNKLRKHLSTAFKLTLLLGFVLQLNPLLSQVTNRSGGDSTIFISNTIFVPNHPYASGNECWGVVIEDMNGDGKKDVVSVSKLDNGVNVHLNNGKGELGPRKPVKTGGYPRDLCALDINKDGKMDIATVSIQDQKLTWFLNDGSGSLSGRKSIVTGPNPHDIKSGDFNGDGRDDVATVTLSNSMLNIHMNDGKGGFKTALSQRSGSKPRSLAITDFDGDGDLDILVGDDYRNINIHINQGGGVFKKEKAVLSVETIWGLVAEDFNKDGKMDIAAASYEFNKLVIHLNEGGYNFSKQVIESGDKIFDMVAGDFDMDGDVDLVVASSRDEVINVHLNDGNGVFSAKNTIPSGNWNSGIAAADMDGDKDLDIVTSSIKDSRLNVHRNVSIEPEKEANSTCVYGTIYDKDANKPMPGMVSILGEDGYSIKSMKVEADGKYEFCGLPFRRGFTLSVKCSGFPKYQDQFDLPKSLGKEGLKKDVYLAKIKATFVYGKVIDAESGEALVGAEVEIKDKEGKVITTQTTVEKGSYKYELPFDVDYQLTASAEKYMPKSGKVSLYPNNYPKGVKRNFELQKVKPKTTAPLEGFVFDEKSREKISGAEVNLTDSDGNTIATATTDSDGHYEAIVPFGDYDIAATRKGYMYKADKVTILPSHIETGLRKDMELLKLEIGMKIVLKDIYYDVAKATLRPESITELDRLIGIMRQNPTLKVEISGHTDSDGSAEYNQKLSQARAQSVVDYLTDASVSDDRLVAKGYGEIEPIAPNDTPENKQLNRRTEFKVLDF